MCICLPSAQVSDNIIELHMQIVCGWTFYSCTSLAVCPINAKLKCFTLSSEAITSIWECIYFRSDSRSSKHASIPSYATIQTGQHNPLSRACVCVSVCVCIGERKTEEWETVPVDDNRVWGCLITVSAALLVTASTAGGKEKRRHRAMLEKCQTQRT